MRSKKQPAFSLASFAILIVTLMTVASCGSLAKQMGAAKSFSDCQFRLHSVQDVSLQGIPAARLRSLGAFEAMKLGSAFSEDSLWLRFIVNIEVKNPNPVRAAMNKVEAILIMDEVEMFHGTLAQKVELPPGPISIAQFPIAVQVDLKQVFSRSSAGALLNLAINFSGMGSRPTQLMARIRPTIEVAGLEFEFPNFMDVRTEYASRTRRVATPDGEPVIAPAPPVEALPDGEPIPAPAPAPVQDPEAVPSSA